MSQFKQKILQVVRMIPKGRVVSYGQVALIAGIPRAARQVGQVLARNVPKEEPSSPDLPWWRVINNAGRISIKNPNTSANKQKELLEKEGIEVSRELTLNIEKYRWRPDPLDLTRLELPEDYIEEILQKYQI